MNRTYAVTVEWTTSVTLEVKAADETEAREIAPSLAIAEHSSAPAYYLDPRVTHVEECGAQRPRRGA